MPFPGSTYAEHGHPNWVGHLVYRLRDRTRLVVYDFAKGGDTTEGVERQIEQEFLPNLADQPPPPDGTRIWSANDTLFAIWVGINDCGYSGPDRIPPKLVKLFSLVDLLYSAGARHFMLIDIPPINRSPAMRDPPRGKLSFEEWNDCLRARAADFARTHSDATVVIYSAWDTFTRVLNNPSAFGFNGGDVRRRGGTIWVDHIHPSSQMHDEIAKDIAALLQNLPVPEEEPEVV